MNVVAIVHQPADQLVIDVSGQHAHSQFDDELHPDNVSVIHVQDLHRLVAKSTPQSQLNAVASDYRTVDGSMVVYIHRSVVQTGYRILDILPSLKSLRRNEQCSVSSAAAAGDHDDDDDYQYSSLFYVDELEGTNVLKFARAVKHSTVYRLRVTCHAVIGDKSDPFELPLELHVV